MRRRVPYGDVERKRSLDARMGIGLATKTFELGFLNDAMTVVAIRRDA